MFQLSIATYLFCCTGVTIATRSGVLRSQKVVNYTRAKSSLRVYKGVDDYDDRYPYVVALGVPPEIVGGPAGSMKFVRTCSGTLITGEWVLTASHCMNPETKLPTMIRYGTTVKNDTAARYSEVLVRMYHPCFKVDLTYGELLYHDIGLMKVAKVTLAAFGRVSAVDYRTLVGLPVTVVGYGAFSLAPSRNFTEYVQTDPKTRKVGHALIIPCPRKLLHKFRPGICIVGKCLPERMQHTALKGDSGGPLLQGGQIVGVTSTLSSVNRVNYTVYTPVSFYLEWIYSQISHK